MLDDISNETYGNENLLQEQLRLQARRQRQIEAAKEAQRQAGINSQGRMVDGIYVKAPKLAAFVPIVQQLAAHVEDRAYDEQNRALNSRITKAQAEHLRAYPGPDADTKAALEWSMTGAQIPGMQPVMEKFLQDRLVAAPEREAARQSKAEQAAAALAEKKERQERELEYRRESDRIRSEDRRYQTDQNSQLRRDLHGAMARNRSNSSGPALPADIEDRTVWKIDKNPASKNIRTKDNEDGTTTMINLVTGETVALPGQIARPSAKITEQKVEQATKVRNAKDGLIEMDNIDALLNKATGSGAGALVDKAAGFFGGSTPGADAAQQLTAAANELASKLDRMPGAVSDADLMFIKGRLGDMGNPEVPTSRRKAAAKDVRARFNRIVGNPGQEASGTIRDSLESAVQQHSTPPKRMKFNPATGKLE